MAVRLVLVTEILSIIVCIHRIYGRKVTWNFRTVLVFLGVLTVLEISNTCETPKAFSLLVYFFLFLYTYLEFEKSIAGAVVSNVIYFVVVTFLEVICLMPAALFFPKNENFRALSVNCGVLLFCIFALPRLRLERFRKMMQKKEKVLALGVIFLITAFILVQARLLHGIRLDFFLLLVPLLILIFVLANQCVNSASACRRLESELHKREKGEKTYRKLVTEIRMRQHEINNQLTAVFSMHYMNKTYEDLVREQEKYCGRILKENRYQQLLDLEDGILIGFLYQKFLDMEEDAEVACKVKVQSYRTVISTYHLVEMLGILLDNAVEAMKGREANTSSVWMEIRENREAYEYEIRNPFSYVPYSVMSEWFSPDVSTKGRGRGLGLYHLKCLCAECGCDIICRNIRVKEGNGLTGENVISFLLRIKKRD